METLLKNFDLVPFDVVMIAVCAILFVVLWQALSKFLFLPYLALIEAREAATVGAEDLAEEKIVRANNLLQEFEEKVMSARVEAMQKKMSKIDAAKSEASKILEQAEALAQEKVRAVRWDIANTLDSVRQSAMGQVDELAEMIIKQVQSPARSSTRDVQN